MFNDKKFIIYLSKKSVGRTDFLNSSFCLKLILRLKCSESALKIKSSYFSGKLSFRKICPTVIFSLIQTVLKIYFNIDSKSTLL